MTFNGKVRSQTPMTERHEHSHEQVPFEEAHTKDLLRPEAFDWAEDVEEALAAANQATAIPRNMPSPPDRPCGPIPWAERDSHFDDLEPAQPPGFMTRFGFHELLSTIEEEGEPINGRSSSEVQAMDSGTTSATEDDWSGSSDVTSPTSSIEEPLLPNGESTSQCPSDTEEAAAAALAQTNLTSIFADRQLWIDFDRDIHHFNWMGLRSYTHYSTTPSESLAIILSKPKDLQGSDKLRRQAVLNQAMHHIDPVIVRLHGPDDNLIDLRGSALARESQGRVHKFYSPHGRWLNDQRDTTDACIDTGSIDIYGATRFAVGNGFVESSCIPSVHEWMESKPEVSGGLESLPRKSTWKAKPSPLKRHQSTGSSVGSARRRRPITTCVRDAPPEVYTSFPTPVFARTRRTGIKRLWEKSRHKLAAALSSVKSKMK
ncbi:uncharacterized protein N7515_009894 [Penicillium bovifimosum]|uniref:Uncharacterized protein n=1 Tax=Penicillium bovifimosum TaxID=126998 RepID=A0A9W9GHU1_9EURO|nr:uncharacterized protein N7515_009894 [Penicillium bovifimosum]KAJ5120506.1 hypothetical protein N7515_009894 [Penicillium bovifimosum]